MLKRSQEKVCCTTHKNIKYIEHFKNAKITENTEQCLNHWLGFLDVWRNSEALFK